MNMDVLSRVFDIVQRAGGMEQISQLMVIVYGALCIFGILNCILGYRILRFWMMIFGFLIGAGAGFAVTYMSGVQDKMVIIGAMAGLGIVLAIVSFLVYRAGIFVLGFGIGISLSIYLVHPTSSFSFFLCILVGVGLGVLAMRYAKGVIIIGTSVLGGILAGLSIAKIAGLAQFPYGVGMAAGIVLCIVMMTMTKRTMMKKTSSRQKNRADARRRLRIPMTGNIRPDTTATAVMTAGGHPQAAGSLTAEKTPGHAESMTVRRDIRTEGQREAEVVLLTEEAEEAEEAEETLHQQKETHPEEAALQTAGEAVHPEEAPVMTIRMIMRIMIVLIMRKTEIHTKILKNGSRETAGWISKIWRITMSRMNPGKIKIPVSR